MVHAGWVASAGRSRKRFSPILLFAFAVLFIWIFGTGLFFVRRLSSHVGQDMDIRAPLGQETHVLSTQARRSELPVLKASASVATMQAAVEALLERVVTAEVTAHFVVEVVGGTQGHMDWFEISGGGAEKVLLRGTTGVAVASALNWYLRYEMSIDTSWNAPFPLEVPLPLRPASQGGRRKSAVEWSYYENVCTFSYSQAWWDWPRWEREIDWMAMSGINLPLALTGQEYVTQSVFKKFGLNEDDMADYFTGPAFLAWNRMINIKKWAGPLPQSFIVGQMQLQKKILRRERELGMVPVLPAFSGGVPEALASLFPTAQYTRHGNWGGFESQYCCLLNLSPQDPLFTQIGAAFVEEVKAVYGTDHVYSCDTFNENRPGSGSGVAPLDALAASSAAVYESMRQADPQAVWLMQGWLFMNDARFWQEPQLRAYLGAVPKANLIVLDLFTEVFPVWKRADLPRPTPIEGLAWVWNMLHSFGGNSGTYGRMQVIARDPVAAKKHSPEMIGIGITTEGIQQNPAVYELMAEMRWHANEEVDLETWIHDWSDRRLGPKAPPHRLAIARNAWNLLAGSALSCPTQQMGQVKSMIECRPRLDLYAGYIANSDFMPIRRHYKESVLISAWHELFSATEGHSDGFTPSRAFLYDLADLTRQVLADLFARLYINYVAFVQNSVQIQSQRSAARPALPTGPIKTKEDAADRADVLKDIIRDIDKLLGSQDNFLLGKWIGAARQMGTTPEEQALFEFNARNQITMWGPRGEIGDYASKQWSGLLESYYLPRWEIFFNAIQKAMDEGSVFDEDKTQLYHIYNFELGWQRKTTPEFSASPKGDTLAIIRELRHKYLELIEQTAEDDIYADALPIYHAPGADILSGHA